MTMTEMEEKREKAVAEPVKVETIIEDSIIAPVNIRLSAEEPKFQPRQQRAASFDNYKAWNNLLMDTSKE